MAKQKNIPKRSEVEKQYTWALEDIFATDELWEKALDECRTFPEKIEAFRGRLAESADMLYSYLTFCDELDVKITRVAEYIMRKSDEDTGNSYYNGLKGRFMSVYINIAGASSFDTPEILAIPDEKLAAFMNEKPELRLYERKLAKIRSKKDHILSDAEEKLLAAAGEMANAPEEIASAFRNADIRFPSIYDADGNELKVTQGSYVPLLENPDRNVRKAAFESLHGTFESFKNTSAAFLDGQIKQLIFYAKARRYNSTLEAALAETEVPVSVYRNLIDAVNANLEYLHKYIALRKKLTGSEELHMYDLYVPLVADPFKEIAWSDAKEMMYRYLAPLGGEYLANVRAGLDEGWADIFPNRGKRSGAYSWGAYGTHPYIFMNYTNNLNDVMTLVHEMGHSMHSFYSRRSQPYATADYCIFTAEVASTTNEVLFLSGLLSETEKKKRRLYLLNRRLENIRTTVYRQTMFASFEREAHLRSANGGDTTPDGLKELWYELNRKYYGETVVIDEPLKMEWARIPHFYSPFYVYQYATGFSAATALAQAVLAEGAPATERYLNFLTKGGSDYPIELLKGAGVDMSTPEPVKAVVKQFEETLDEMEALL